MSNFEKEIYISLEEAKEEIWKRWGNKRLKGKVVEFMGDVPDVFSNEPKSVLFRHIISPNNELLYFGEQSVHINLKPICIEYLHDKLCTWNHDKLYLAKMPLFKRKNKHGEIIFQYKKIADIQKYDGRDICDVETSWGENLIEFHHRILSDIHSGIEYFDGSSWYKLNGGSAAIYYQKYLMLFICHGVLFENFVTNAEEQRFAEEVVYPAFKEVEQLFGLKPLIVPLLPPHSASDKYWFCYSEDIEKEVLRCLDSCKR